MMAQFALLRPNIPSICWLSSGHHNSAKDRKGNVMIIGKKDGQEPLQLSMDIGHQVLKAAI